MLVKVALPREKLWHILEVQTDGFSSFRYYKVVKFEYDGFGFILGDCILSRLFSRHELLFGTSNIKLASYCLKLKKDIFPNSNVVTSLEFWKFHVAVVIFQEEEIMQWQDEVEEEKPLADITNIYTIYNYGNSVQYHFPISRTVSFPCSVVSAQIPGKEK